jgi:hypothetical protein
VSSRSTTRSTPEGAPRQPDEFLELVLAREQGALAALADAAGDASLCALSRAGTPHPAAKFHEGAAAALAGVRRSLRRGTGTGPSDAVATARRRWKDQNAALATRGRDWAAYYAGGVDALDRLAASTQD